MINLCGLWKNQDKNGKVYYSGLLGNCKILVFANENKKSEKAPDFNLCITEKEFKKNEGHDQPVANPWAGS